MSWQLVRRVARLLKPLQMDRGLRLRRPKRQALNRTEAHHLL